MNSIVLLDSMYAPDPILTLLPVALTVAVMLIVLGFQIHMWLRNRREKRHKMVPINPDKLDEIKNKLETRGKKDEGRIGHTISLTAVDGTTVSLMNTNKLPLKHLQKAVTSAIETRIATDLTYQLEPNGWKALWKRASPRRDIRK